MLFGMPTSPILECVFNLSEGRRGDVIDLVVASANNTVLDVHSDPDHNRSVVTLAGNAEQLVQGLVEATRAAVEQIDLTRHAGVHPRMGSMDVVPFIPLFEFSMTDAQNAAHECAERIGRHLSVPVFIYGLDRQLPDIRREAFRSIKPDFGPDRPHPTAGAVSVGAREVLVAFNVNIQATLEIANSLAEQVRKLPNVRALGFYLKSKHVSQVSMNLTRPTETTIPMVFDSVARNAAELTVEIVEAELVGLAPRDSFSGREAESLGLNSPPKILEQELARVFGDQNR